MTPNQAAVFRVIEECAAAGEVCPAGPILAERAGLLITSVGSAIYQLQDQGIIEIQNVGHGKRVVTIVATGAETAMPEGCSKGQPIHTPSESFAAILPPPRDPCWQCGTRMDYGCEHQRWAA